jgi:peptide/nickel transport system permease protein
MRKPNTLLIIGSLILICILAVMLFPQLFTDKSPYEVQLIRFSSEGGKLLVESAPYPPSENFLLGSDDMGRDIQSYIVYGTRMTILLGLLIALGRFLIAIPLALSGGFGNGISRTLIKQSNIVFSAIPALLISIVILTMEFFTGLDKVQSMLAFAVVLSVVGWPKLGNLIMERTEAINKQPFIRGEVALGKKRRNIALENVLPHLAPELIVLFFMEIARTLSMIMQLGIFSVFVGNLKIIKDSSGGILTFYNVSFEPEWASMLSTSRNLVRAAPWAILFPALAFFISVLGFNLFGEGLRNAMQKEGSKVVPLMRNLFTLHWGNLWKSVGLKGRRRTIVVVVVLLLVAGASFITGGDYTFSKEMQLDLPYEQVVIGDKSALETAHLIAEEMQDLGIESLSDEAYLLGYEIPPSCLVSEQMFQINGPGEALLFQAGEEYDFLIAADLERTATVYDASREDMYSLDDYERFAGKFVMIDQAYYNNQAIDYFIRDIAEHVSIKGVLLIARDGEKLDQVIARRGEDYLVLRITGELADSIRENGSFTVTASAHVRPLGVSGNNVLGIYRGSDPYTAEEAILIGMRYNYLDEKGEEVLEFNLELMRQMCTLYENKRSLIFVFFDGTLNEQHDGSYPLSEDFPYSSSKIKAYIDLRGLQEPSFDAVRFSTAQAPFTRAYAWSLGRHLQKELQAQGMDIHELETVYSGSEFYFTGSTADNLMFWERGIASIILGTEQEGRNEHRLEEIGSILLEVINKNNY